MKICVCGKGGSGKTTIIKLMADVLRDRGCKVIVLDSDESNPALYRALGLSAPPCSLMESLGGKRAVQEKMRAAMARGEEEPALSIWQQDSMSLKDLPSDYVAENRGIYLIQTGKIERSMEGCACPMGVVTREFLKKFSLHTGEIMLVDMEAGIEHFGRGIETGVDGVVCVVEPSYESVLIAQNVMKLTSSSGASFKGCVLNKVMDEDQEMNLRSLLDESKVPVIGRIGYYQEIQKASLAGMPPTCDRATAEMVPIVDRIFK
ncbi:hypothetical protein [Thermodesulforhabdus norvegica]|uniref:CO dehydrogenase maturation factor n=1 Tax=Thermodesulforhabdus norvegica TaxID=39841 RepID=A0A1I4S8B9_9BACT|nr:hypothetical protein [Thermodesulforhabdus norvegica]SFM60540.1 CO dehydrogenase maturation factor [Thermodesulforhabdus norvegica]